MARTEKVNSKRGLTTSDFLSPQAEDFLETHFPGLITRARRSLLKDLEETRLEYNNDYKDWLNEAFKNIEKVKKHIEQINSGKKQFAHPKGQGYHNDCGPHIISIVTGLPLDQVIEDMEFADVFDDKDYGTYPKDMIDTLRFYDVIENDERFIPVKNINSIKRTSILGVNRHWVLLVVDTENDDRFILDPQFKKPRRDFNRIPKLESYLPLKCFD
ncbi:MAG: hypothetical protein OHK0056_32830 [Bacteriovoracaceae bacterium]